MSVFNRAWRATKRTARKVSDKTAQALDSAATAIKIKNLEAKIAELYEKLGRIVYRDLHIEDDLENEKLETVAAIDALFDRITELKAAKDAAGAPEAQAEDTCECCEEQSEAEAEKAE